MDKPIKNDKKPTVFLTNQATIQSWRKRIDIKAVKINIIT